MAVLLVFACLSGVITILSPCILPVLAIVLSGGVGGGKARPLGVVLGFVASFTFATLALSAIVRAVGIPADALRAVAVILIVVFGAVMVVPWLRDMFEIVTSRIGNWGTSSANADAAASGTAGLWGGLAVGLGLGLVWTPCVGPIMASVISLAVTEHVNAGAVFITLAYSLGASIPMLAVMFGGRAIVRRLPVLTRHGARVQTGFGVLMIVMGLAIGFGYDRRLQAAILRVFPSYGAGLTALENVRPVSAALKARSARVFDAAAENVVGDYGRAPAFVTNATWFNTQDPLTIESLRGKVVLVDFWTYSCVNCVRTLPYLRTWHETYRNSGLVIVGVHTPEFEFEKNAANVAQAIRDLGVAWPVVQDNDYRQWKAYANQYWPAHYFIDRNGRVRYVHSGEGNYDESEKVIRQLLAETGASVGGVASMPARAIEAHTAEMYLGYGRSRGFVGVTEPVPDAAADYVAPRAPGNGEWSLAGRWSVTSQYVAPDAKGTLLLGFHAKNVFLVIEPRGPGATITVTADGKPAADTADVKNGLLEPRESRLYQLAGFTTAGDHQLRLDVRGEVRLFAFTFG